MLTGARLLLLVLLLVGASLAGCLGSSGNVDPQDDTDKSDPQDKDKNDPKDDPDENETDPKDDPSEEEFDPPVASISVLNAAFLVGEPIEFNASDSSDPQELELEYSWDFGDETTDTGVVVTHTYAEAGTFNVTLNVTSESGLYAVDVTQVEVEDAQYPEFSATVGGELAASCPLISPYRQVASVVDVGDSLEDYEGVCPDPFDYEVLDVESVPEVPEEGHLTFTIPDGGRDSNSVMMAVFDVNGNLLRQTSRACQLGPEDVSVDVRMDPDVPMESYKVFVAYNCPVTPGDGGPVPFPLEYDLEVVLKEGPIPV